MCRHDSTSSLVGLSDTFLYQHAYGLLMCLCWNVSFCARSYLKLARVVNNTLHHVEQQPKTCEKSYPVTMHFEQGSLKGLEMLVVAVVALRHSAGESNLPSTQKQQGRGRRGPVCISEWKRILECIFECKFIAFSCWLRSGLGWKSEHLMWFLRLGCLASLYLYQGSSVVAAEKNIVLG